MLGQLLQLHDGRRIEERDLVQARQLGQPGPGAGVDQDLVGRQVQAAAIVEAHRQGLVPREARLAHEEVHALGILDAAPDALAKALHDLGPRGARRPCSP